VRLYLEAIEILPPEAPPEYIPEFIRIDVTEKDWRTELAQLKMQLSPDKSYRIQLHYCRHDETPIKPCKAEVIG